MLLGEAHGLLTTWGPIVSLEVGVIFLFLENSHWPPSPALMTLGSLSGCSDFDNLTSYRLQNVWTPEIN